MRRPVVDFYHLFDEDELFGFKTPVLIVKKFRLAIGVATVVRKKIGTATTLRTKIGIATIHRTKAQG